ncbi:MAG: GNAT family N-acetyltransferase [Comamonadaceae bacterium]|nr:MAG: GNAT family N-acetyltransferase [Comamonadaceae bacterium]
MSEYQVRPATLRDSRAVAEVHALTAKAAYRGIIPDDELTALAPGTREAKWREAIEFSEPQVHVATLDDEIVGFVGFDRSRDPKTPATTGEIWAIYVKPEHWDRGVGVALWDAARDGLEEEGCTVVTLWLPLRNDRALRFAELAGFKRDMKTARTSQLGSVKIEEVRLKRTV